MQEIAALRLQVTVLEHKHDTDGTEAIILQRFLKESTSYAETVLEGNVSSDEGELSEPTLSYPGDHLPAPTHPSVPAQGANFRDSHNSRYISKDTIDGRAGSGVTLGSHDRSRSLDGGSTENVAVIHTTQASGSEGIGNASDKLPGFSKPDLTLTPQRGIAKMDGVPISALPSRTTKAERPAALAKKPMSRDSLRNYPPQASSLRSEDVLKVKRIRKGFKQKPKKIT